jgi:hypothetical protein
MDSQVTRSRQRILESAVVLLREGNLPGQLAEAAAARVPLANAKQFFQNDEELLMVANSSGRPSKDWTALMASCLSTDLAAPDLLAVVADLPDPPPTSPS